VPRTCTICAHDQRHSINVALVQREPYRAVARQYGVSRDALARHSREHLPKLLVKASRSVEAADADDLLARVEELFGEAKAVLEAAKGEHDYRIVLAAIDRAGRQLELLARLRGELNEQAINLHLHPEWVSLKTVIVAALAPHPEARAAIMRALAARREEEANGVRP
jgi:hypothetical protein